MSSGRVTGRSREELETLRKEWNESHDRPFSEKHCLSKIGKQPEEYDGPQRYCINQETYETPLGKWRCPYHGGTMDDYRPENFEKLANMKHGLFADDDHLREDFDDKDEAIYDWIVKQYKEAYDIKPRENPAAAYDLHRLATEIVRAERGRGYLIREGEVYEREVTDENGRVVVDDNGQVVTEKSEHYLAQMMHRQDKKISDIQKELAVTRREQKRQESTEDAVDALKNFAELGSKFLDRDNTEYDPDDEPWSEDDDAD